MVTIIIGFKSNKTLVNVDSTIIVEKLGYK